MKAKRKRNLTSPRKAGSAGYDVHIGARKKHFDSHEAARRHALGEQNKGVHAVFVIVDSATGARHTYKRGGEKTNPTPKELGRMRVLRIMLERERNSPKPSQKRIDKMMAEYRELEKKPNPRRNPEAAAVAMREAFTGRPSEETIVVDEKLHVHSRLAKVGDLVQMKVKTLKGETFTIDFGKTENPKSVGKKVRGWIGRRAKTVAGVVGGIQKAWINPKKINPNGTPILAVTEDGKNLQVLGGNQSLDLKALGMGEFSDKESVIVGSIKTIDYFETKDWKDGKKPETAIYTHRLNEETGGPLPMLRYDTRNRKCFIDGGLYRINKPLFGGTSAGLEN